MRLIFFAVFMYCTANMLVAQVPDQPVTRADRLKSIASQLRERYRSRKIQAVHWALTNRLAVRQVNDDGSVIEIQWLDERNQPVYFTTDNLNAARTVSTDSLWSGGGLGLSLDGSGFIIGEWDGGRVLNTHDELIGRVTQQDGATSLSDHSTHVAGTMIASGVWSLAKGMAGAEN